ncbi:hypothetical protein CASFOL_005148 [Castilleja foliolosa]|uniref:Uncharacterized protein n=1 Tax=Castilleja foliolosa TaxID=1961234 RepID=A0ABD3BER8_9LAMI
MESKAFFAGSVSGGFRRCGLIDRLLLASEARKTATKGLRVLRMMLLLNRREVSGDGARLRDR